MKMKFAYQIAFIDYHWGNLKTVSDIAYDLLNSVLKVPYSNKNNHENEYNIDFLNEFLNNWSEAQKMAFELGWEGDFRHNPEVFWMPIETAFEWGFVFKQNNNGTTFVISPIELPWLDSKDSCKLDLSDNSKSAGKNKKPK